MPMVVQCSTCGATNKARREDAGKRAKCPRCGMILVIREVRPQHAQQGHTTEDPGTQKQGCPLADHGNGPASSGDRDRAITPARTTAVRGDQRVQMRAAPATASRQLGVQEGGSSTSSSDPCRCAPHLAEGQPQQTAPFNKLAFVIFILFVLPAIRCCLSANRPNVTTTVPKAGSFSPGRLDNVPPVVETKQPSDWLPADGIYSAVSGSGGSYRDPIHGFFELQPPPGFDVTEKRDKSQFAITQGPGTGTIVPRSWIVLRKGNANIGIIARTTFSCFEDDFQVVLYGLREKLGSAAIGRHRYITIDGVKGGEILATAQNLQILTIKYKKGGLDHAITITCPAGEFSGYAETFVTLLRSYRGTDTTGRISGRPEIPPTK